MKSLLALVILGAAMLVGACNSNSGSSSEPTLAPLPTDTTTAEPITSPEASPS